MVKYFLCELSTGYALLECNVLLNQQSLKHSLEDMDLNTFTDNFRLVHFQRFHSVSLALEQTKAISKGEVTTELFHFLSMNLPKVRAGEVSGYVLGVADPLLGKHIYDMMKIRCESSGLVLELLRGVRLHIHSLIEYDEQWENDDPWEIDDHSEYEWISSSGREWIRRLGRKYSRENLALLGEQLDQKVIQGLIRLDGFDYNINNFSKRLRGWYSCHFPELGKLVPDDNLYAKVVYFLGDKSEFSENKLQDLINLVGNEAKAKKILIAAKASMGHDLSTVDFIIVNSTAKKIMDLSESRETLYADLVEDMSCRAPNLAALVGDVIGARLISAAGSLPNLAKISAEELQILGAEESHFRPKYGLICQSSLIARTSDGSKDRMARYLADQCSVASHMDCFSENFRCDFGQLLRGKVKKQLCLWERSEVTSTERSEVTKRNKIVFADGFVYHDLEKGDGRPALPGKMVTIQFSGWLNDGTMFMDEISYAFRLGRTGDYWDVGICGMHVGGRREFTVPLTVEYMSGALKNISVPPGEDLVFKVQLLDVRN